MKASLIFLGTSADASHRITTPDGLAAGAIIPLEVKHAHRWSRTDVTRIIVGSNPDRADVLLVDAPPAIHGEHVRFYLNHNEPTASELRPMRRSPVSVNGTPLQDFQWTKIQSGDEIQFGPWRFRYEVV